MSKMIHVNHEDSVLRTFILFMQMAQAVYKYSDNYFYRKSQVTTATFVALKVLITQGGTMTHTELAKWTNTKRHNITSLVERMTKEQLVTTERSKKDKRYVHISVTNKGHKAFEQASPIAQSIREQLMRGIKESDAREFERLLTIIRANIERH
jgi:DNA-binding MarR family transcriptional regulator